MSSDAAPSQIGGQTADGKEKPSRSTREMYLSFSSGESESKQRPLESSLLHFSLLFQVPFIRQLFILKTTLLK